LTIEDGSKLDFIKLSDIASIFKVISIGNPKFENHQASIFDSFTKKIKKPLQKERLFDNVFLINN
jgi:hypothetical protein